MKSTLQKIFVICITLFLASTLYGQGTLRGLITDSLTRKGLVGANVFFISTAIGGATNINGEYSIKAIPSGNYTIKISYLGYKSSFIDVIIQEDKVTSLDVYLSPEIIEGEEVVVTGQMMGQMSAINQQHTSNTIINVIYEEKIKELPDANAAESIGRLPGVSILRSGGEANKVILRGLEDKFTVVTIDGMKIPPTDATSRGIDLSMISQSALAGIELYKALTSDKDGDALAGSINLVTKIAPETREIRTDLKGDYNSLMNSLKQYDFSLHYGERFFDGFLGVQLNGNLENRIRTNERINVNYGFDQGFGGDYFINNFRLEFTDETRKRDGFGLLLDLKTPDEGTIRWNNIYSRTKRDYLWSYREYTSNGGGNYDGPAYDYRDREQEIKNINSSIRGDNNLLGFKLSWNLSFAQSESFYPYDYEAIFVEDNGMNASPQLKSNPEQLVSYAVNNYLNASLDWAYLRTQDNFDKERTGFLDISRPYVFGDLFSGEIKVGGKYRMKNRSNSSTQDFTPYYLGRWMEYERLPDGTFRKKDFTGTYFEEWWKLGVGAIGLNQFFTNLESRDIYNSYPLNPFIIRDRLRQWQALNQYGVNSSGSYLPNAQEVWDNLLIRYDNYNIADYYIETNGAIKTYKLSDFNIDNIAPGRTLLRLYAEIKDEKYKNAADTLREQLRLQPRTNEGGFWHKKIYPYQMWLDGLYMGEPFYVMYTQMLGDTNSLDDIANQFIFIRNHLKDNSSGLYYHGWDESKKQKWADPITGRSPNFWGRAIGWYMMALVDVLDFFPIDHPKRNDLLEIFINLSESLIQHQDPKTKLWYQVLDKGNLKGNYLEASGSLMFIYSFAKGANKGYLKHDFFKIASESFNSVYQNLVTIDEQGFIYLNNICAGAGLGGNPYRDGSVDYYINETRRVNDFKGYGPFILASIEIEKGEQH